MDDIHINFDDNDGDDDMSYFKKKKLPDINSNDQGYNKEKASNLFSAMSNAIEEEQEKYGSSNLNPIDRHWENGAFPKRGQKKPEKEQEDSDSFDVDVDPNNLGGQNINQKDDSDDEFDIVDNQASHKFK